LKSIEKQNRVFNM